MKKILPYFGCGLTYQPPPPPLALLVGNAAFNYVATPAGC